MLRVLLSLIVTACSGYAVTAAEPTAGNWKISFLPNSTIEVVEGIVKLSKDGSNWKTELVAPGYSRDLEVEKMTVTGDRVVVVAKRGGAEVTFEGRVVGEKKMRGDWSDGRRFYAAEMNWTEDDSVPQARMIIRKPPPAGLAELGKMQTEMTKLREKLKAADGDDEKAKVREEIAAQAKRIESETPKIQKKFLTSNPDSLAALDIVGQWVSAAGRNGAKPEEVREWVATAKKITDSYGQRFSNDSMVGLAEGLVRTNDLKPLAKELALSTEKAFAGKIATDTESRLVTVLLNSVDANSDAGKEYAGRLTKLEAKLDDEYKARHAKWKPEGYAGRKNGGNRVVLLELFTGAQCPPCVAADLAFDKLAEVYKPTDVVLLQYHLHIPGPDPLTNSDTEARWKYYTKAYPGKVGGTPTTVFNGSPEAGGGGGEPNAPKKLTEYRKVIDSILDETGKDKITLKAVRSGDDIKLAASAQIGEVNENLRLRFALVEESVKYVGSNGLRFHHHVVRALPGGAEGMEVTGTAIQREVNVNLGKLKQQLTKYLDDTNARRPYPKPHRPMDMKKLKAVAWIQDDKTHAVLAVAEAEIVEGTAG